jgi:hypothetical protein
LGSRVANLAIAALMACDGLLLVYLSVFTDARRVIPIPVWVIVTLCLLAIAMVAYLVIMTVSLKAIYDSEAVEIRCAIPLPRLWLRFRQTGRMLRSDIAAKRNLSIFWPSYVLYPKERNKGKLAIWVPKEDEYFRNWIAGIPDVDRQFFWNRRKSNRKP